MENGVKSEVIWLLNQYRKYLAVNKWLRLIYRLGLQCQITVKIYGFHSNKSEIQAPLSVNECKKEFQG